MIRFYLQLSAQVSFLQNSIVCTFLLSGLFLTMLPCTAGAQSNPTINLTWAPQSGPGLAGFYIYWRTPGSNYTTANRIQVANPAATSAAITSLPPATRFFQATAYNTANQESAPSPEVAVLSLRPSLETGTASERPFEVEIQNTAGEQLVVVDATASGSGYVHVPFNTVALPAAVNVRLKAAGYLRRAYNARAISDTAIYAPPLIAGDINNDNIVNSFDFAAIRLDYYQRGQQSDLNSDGITNGLDYAYVNAHYFLSGD